ncbi:DUF6443 domain-containing protein [Chryseobacterium aurantiacum]|uniref:DUF6443 domain-containing protein n=1 Tax=Chryseobacterium aurantiacum TaxID=2116499 RepID=UPI000D1212C1|nr:DUF6443 domain-containing protein [Chryseobacterium aurantiacum]
MKKILIPLGMLLLTPSVHAQLSNTENYIYTKTYLDYNGTIATKSSETVQYFDGLGRPKQVVNVKASPLGRDVVTHIEYDGFGRQTMDYLPVPQSGTLNGGIAASPLANATQPGIYGSEKIYSERTLESSPLDRLLEQRQVGSDWANKPVRFQYEANTTTDYVRKYETSTTWVEGRTQTTVQLLQYFLPNQLYKNTVTDEDGNKTIEFKNGKGQVLLVRKALNATENADTYYVYNEYDQLAYVIPPLASAPTVESSTMENLYYQYRYDGKNHLVEKKLPGKGWEYMVYDKQDRLVATRDANLRAKGQWLYTKYDQFSRPCITGICTGGERIAEQTLADAVSSNNLKSIDYVFFPWQGMDVYYNYPGTTYPSSDKWVDMLSVNYYDFVPGYSFNPSFPTNILGEPTISGTPNADGISTKGLAVLSIVKNIEDNSWTKNYSYYDKKGRVIGTHSINHLGGYTKTESRLDFAGAAQNTVTTHLRRAGEPEVTVKESFAYDNQNRLLRRYHQVDYWPEQLLVENSYNELSQLKNKTVGSNLQSIDYAYNIRGWLTDINKNDMPISNLNGKLFSYKIKYNQKNGTTNPDMGFFVGKNVKPMYNGNIVEVDWRAVESLGANPPLEPKRYGYAYDGLNRLTAGYYQNPNNPWSKEHTETMDYDLNGNITKLYRTSAMNGTTAMVIDDLVYNYGPPTSLGNRLLDVRDNQHNKAGYEGGGNTISYDANGNLINMLDKQITGISYNFLNLPRTLDIGYGTITSQIRTNYRADGIKLRKENMQTSVGFAGTSWTKEITDYLDGFQYLNKISSATTTGVFSRKTAFALEEEAFSMASCVVMPPVSDDIGEIINSPNHPELQFFPTAEGFYDYQKKMYIYQYKDHLGNVRVNFGRNSTGVLEITDANDYYPFGMNHLKTGNAFFGVGSYKNYKYNSKELQETGMYDYGWRQYMPDIGRWMQLDPLIKDLDFTFDPNNIDDDDDDEVVSAIETTLGNGGGIFNPDNLSPYSYGYNNPIKFDDPDGRCPTCIVGALVGGLTDYGMQVAANYLDPDVKNKWTDNISYSSIALSAAEGALTQGGSAIRKAAIKTTVMVAKNTVEWNSKGFKAETNVRNIAKNTLVDAAAGGAAKKAGSLVKTAKLDKIANKVNLNSNTKAKNFVQKATGLSSRTSSSISKKVDVKGISKQLSNGIKNVTNKSAENAINARTKTTVDNIKKKTDE